MRTRTKQLDNKIREQVVKIRVNDIEFNEFDEASIKLEMSKTNIVREAIKEYLAQRNIEIWNH